MNVSRAALAASLMFVLATPGCGTESERTPEGGQSPETEHRPAGLGRDDTTATPGTLPSSEQPQDQTELRDRLPPDE